MKTETKQQSEQTKTTTIVSKPAGKSAVRSFKDLGTWQLARELAVAVYRQCELFPQQAASVLSCQMAQASVAACSNIAESFGRRGEEREQSFNTAQAALNRLENYLYIALDLGFLNKAQCDDLVRRGGNTRWALVKLQKINREWMER
jgi:four helix bundle protein